MAEKNAAAEPKKKPVNVKLFLTIGFCVLNLALSGAGVFWVYKSTLGWRAPAITEEVLSAQKDKEDENASSAEPLIYKMEKFTANLSGEPRRSIRVELNLDMLSKNGFEEIVNNDTRAKARDQIVKSLNSKSFADLESIQGKLFLKDELIHQINRLLSKGVVKDIYFSDFVVQ